MSICFKPVPFLKYMVSFMILMYMLVSESVVVVSMIELPHNTPPTNT